MNYIKLASIFTSLFVGILLLVLTRNKYYLDAVDNPLFITLILFFIGFLGWMIGNVISLLDKNGDDDDNKKSKKNKKINKEKFLFDDIEPQNNRNFRG